MPRRDTGGKRVKPPRNGFRPAPPQGKHGRPNGAAENRSAVKRCTLQTENPRLPPLKERIREHGGRDPRRHCNDERLDGVKPFLSSADMAFDDPEQKQGDR